MDCQRWLTDTHCESPTHSECRGQGLETVEINSCWPIKVSGHTDLISDLKIGALHISTHMSAGRTAGRRPKGVGHMQNKTHDTARRRHSLPTARQTWTNDVLERR